MLLSKAKQQLMVARLAVYLQSWLCQRLPGLHHILGVLMTIQTWQEFLLLGPRGISLLWQPTQFGMWWHRAAYSLAGASAFLLQVCDRRDIPLTQSDSQRPPGSSAAF